nr:ankyrin repeat domain-containing protein 26-like isoform X1 [Macaca nemestrina]XP_024643672.1 ankyrin repeat domain-containing protein 26-like isoform X1 [Macaca nemestrina]XP_024643673.1 ankyrin repeat domain-containing protein 26-like isoform X1 [Macaca nemestrina]
MYSTFGPPLYDDVKVQFFSSSLPKYYDNCPFFFWFNTSFIQSNRLYLPRNELDNPHKQKTWKMYPPQFAVEVLFDLGQMNLIDQEKMTTAAAFLFWNYTLHDLCESQLPENKESKEAEQDLEVTSEQKPEKLEGSEKNKPQAEGERKKHARNETEASRNLHDGSTDDHIQQGESGETDGQQIPRTEHEECDSSVPALHMKKVKKNEHEEWITTESVTLLVFKKADLITHDLLQVTDDSSLTEIDEKERRLTKKTSNEKDKVRNQIHSIDGFDDLT